LTRGEISHHNKIISGQNNTILLPQLTPDEERMTKKYGILNKPLSFPKVLSDNVWFLGHHSSKSFGAFPYLVHGYHKQQLVSIMIDVPKYTKSAISAVSSILPKDAKEVDYLFLTHVDDSAQHDEWKREFSSMKRIFHSGDLGENNWVGDETLEDVEILLDGKSIVEDKDLLAYSLDGEIFRIDFNQDDVSVCSKLENVMKEIDTEFLILHTPGHSPGSISLLYKSQENNIQNGTIFTGDTYAYTTRNGGYMTGFPNYGNNLVQQAVTLKCLGQISKLYECVASGHGHVRDYRKIVSVSDVNNDTGINVEADTLKSKDISDAINELIQFRR
jgi:glyoxylase-like metal-dependent hydrolase (beta-lactamase superfamily II)